MSERDLAITGLLVLIAALRPFATLPPPGTAPTTWVHYRSSGEHVPLNTTDDAAWLPTGEPAPSCCIAKQQQAHAARFVNQAMEAVLGLHAAAGGRRRDGDHRPQLSTLAARPLAPAPKAKVGKPKLERVDVSKGWPRRLSPGPSCAA